VIGQEGVHPVPVAIFFFAWLLGFIGGVCAIVGLFKDKRKWLSAIGLALFPFSVLVTV
jgi:hypothetical protein